MNTINTEEIYPDEASCKQQFKVFRENLGVVCSHCKGEEHNWKPKREQYECRKCGFRTALRSGTVLHGSKLPYRYWYIAMLLCCSSKEFYTAFEQQAKQNPTTYEPILKLYHKLKQEQIRQNDTIKSIYLNMENTLIHNVKNLV